jgi:arabinose-5-phosphate isomerase
MDVSVSAEWSNTVAGELEDDELLSLAKAVLRTETEALAELGGRIDEHFARACRLLLACEGRIVVLGMGKSGHIGGKLAATLASTGSPAFFVHPGEASHGDMGMITAKDVVVALSNSGETDELVVLLPIIKRLGVPLITLTGQPRSTLARQATVNIDVSVVKEACPLGLAPTASTTAALAMGDALAITLLQARGFSEQDFALSHPGGTLGRRLLLRIADVMHSGEEMPTVSVDTPLSEALLEMTRKGLGVTAVIDAGRQVVGIFTDGDLRRTLDAGIDVHNSRIGDVMTADCKKGRADMLAAEVLAIMQSYRINALLIVDQDDVLVGVANMHDLLRAGVL